MTRNKGGKPYQFINILRTPCAPIFLRQKITKPKRNWRKAWTSIFIYKKSCSLIEIDANCNCNQIELKKTLFYIPLK